MDRGAWRATVHRVTKSWTQLRQLTTQLEIRRDHKIVPIPGKKRPIDITDRAKQVPKRPLSYRLEYNGSLLLQNIFKGFLHHFEIPEITLTPPIEDNT